MANKLNKEHFITALLVEFRNKLEAGLPEQFEDYEITHKTDDGTIAYTCKDTGNGDVENKGFVKLNVAL